MANKKRATDAAIKQYIHLPRSIRKYTDSIVKGHAARAEKGRKSVIKKLKGKRR